MHQPSWSARESLSTHRRDDHRTQVRFRQRRGSAVVLVALAALLGRVAPAIASATATLPASQGTWIAENAPTANFAADSTLGVSAEPGSVGHTLLQFDLSGIPSCAVVSAATLRLYVDTNDGVEPGTTHAVRRVTAPWTASEATWEQRDGTTSWDTPGGDVGPVTATAHVGSGVGAFVEFDVGSDVTSFVAGSVPNDGWLVEEDSSVGTVVGYAPSDAQPAHAPVLVVTFSGDACPHETSIMCTAAEYPTRLHKRNVTVTDPYNGTSTLMLDLHAHACTPDSVNDTPIKDPTVRYETFIVTQTPAHPFLRNVHVTNSFGPLDLVVKHATLLMVPAGMAIGAPAPAPLPGIDPYVCYRLDFPAFPNFYVTQQDLFMHAPVTIKVRKPRLLCTAASLEGGPVADPTGMMICYRHLRKLPRVPYDIVHDVRMQNALGMQSVVTVDKDDLLCLPSTVVSGGP